MRLIFPPYSADTLLQYNGFLSTPRLQCANLGGTNGGTKPRESGDRMTGSEGRRAYGDGALFYKESRALWIVRLNLGWDADGKRKRWEATGRTREGALNKLRKARIGKVPIATLSPIHVRTIYKAVSVESSLGNANKVYRVLLAALSDAEREGIVPRNVAKLARRARRTPVQTARFVGPHRIHALGKARKEDRPIQPNLPVNVHFMNCAHRLLT
jgi:hypothetical protein